MNIKPIIFSAPMVRALLEGRKSQTRRIMKLPTKSYSGGPIYEHPKMGGWAVTTTGGENVFALVKGDKVMAPEGPALWHQTTAVCIAPQYEVNDLLWVREAWQALHKYNNQSPADIPHGSDILYLADRPDTPWDARKRSPIHMPRWASRITLEVTEVRIQRLQDISEEDAVAEGMVWQEPTDKDREWARDYVQENGGDIDIQGVWLAPGTRQGFGAHKESPQWGPTASFAFRCTWNSIHGPDSWNANPWVAAVTFKPHLCNVDEMLKQRGEVG